MVELKNKGSAVMDAPVSRMPGRSPRTRVYIVDDQTLVRRGLASLIRDERDLVLCGETSNSTTASGEVCDLRPDVVVMELSICGAHGTRFIESIKAIDPGIGVVVLSRLNEAVHAVPALKAGASAFVAKQSRPEAVLEAIRRSRDGKICVSQLVAAQMLDRMASGQGMESFSPDSCLSSRELEILKLLGAGHTTREIADTLEISIKTVETHRMHIKGKANLSSGFELVHLSMRWFGAGARVKS